MHYNKAKFSLEQARSKMQRLKTYTGPKVIKAMDSRVDQTRFDERARGRVLQLEQATLERLQKQLECAGSLHRATVGLFTSARYRVPIVVPSKPTKVP